MRPIDALFFKIMQGKPQTEVEACLHDLMSRSNAQMQLSERHVFGEPLIMMFIQYRYLGALSNLLAFDNTQINLTDPRSGTNALQMACILGQAETVSLLIEHGITGFHQDDNYRNALHYLSTAAQSYGASEENCTLIYRILCEQYPLLREQKDTWGHTPDQLMPEMRIKHPEKGWVYYPMEWSQPQRDMADYWKESRGKSYDDRVSTLQQLMDRWKSHGHDLNAHDFHGKTLLHYAAYMGDMPLFEGLMAERVDVNCEDHLGMTPLHYAAVGHQSTHPDIAQQLIEKGARQQQDKWHRTPQAIAERFDATHMHDVLAPPRRAARTLRRA